MDAVHAAREIKAGIEHEHGHAGSIICTEFQGYITLQQQTPGDAGNQDIQTCDIDNSRNLGSVFEDNGEMIGVTPGQQGGTSADTQATFIDGVNGGTGANVTVTLQALDGTVKVYESVLTNAANNGDILASGNIAFRGAYTIGSTKALSFLAAVNHANGHAGKITATSLGATVTLTQVVIGTAGNTAVTNGANISSVTTANPSNFSGGTPGTSYPLSASFSNGTDKQVNLQSQLASYPKNEYPSPTGEMPALQPSEASLFTVGSVDANTTLIGRDSGPPNEHLSMYISEFAMWENELLDTDDVTALYNNGAPLADITSDSGQYDKSQPKTGSMILPLHGISNEDSFRIQDETGKFKWFQFRTGVAGSIPYTDIGKGVKVNNNAPIHPGWNQEFNSISSEFRVVFNNTAAAYITPVTITLTSVKGNPAGTTKTYEGVHANTGNGILTAALNTSWVSNTSGAADKAGNLAAAITSSNGHGLSKFSCSIATTLIANDTLIISNVEKVLADDWDAQGYPVSIDTNTPLGFTDLTASQAGGNELNLSASFTNIGASHRIAIPMGGLADDATVEWATNRGYEDYIKLAGSITASIQHKNAFRESISCSIVHTNAENETVDNSGNNQPAVKLHMINGGGLGNTPVVYGHDTSVAAFSNGEGDHSGWPVVGLPHHMVPTLASNGNPHDFTRFYSRAHEEKNDQEPSVGVNKRWYHEGAKSESFSGGGLRLVGWWKCDGPAIDPRDQRVNVISNTVASSSMMEQPNHKYGDTCHHAFFDNGTTNIHVGKSHRYVRTNPAMNVGGTWTADTPKA